MPIKLRILRWEGLPDCTGESDIIVRVVKSTKGKPKRREDVLQEDGQRHATGGLWKLRTARPRTLSRSPERNAALQHLDFSPAGPIPDSHLQSCKIPRECRFKPRNLRWRATGATGHRHHDSAGPYGAPQPLLLCPSGRDNSPRLGTVRTTGRSETRLPAAADLRSGIPPEGPSVPTFGE